MRPLRVLLHVSLFSLYSLTTVFAVIWRWLFLSLMLAPTELDERFWITTIIATFPILRGFVAFAAPVTPGPLFRWKNGLRKPSPREREQIDGVLGRVPPAARLPKQVLVLDGPGTRTMTVGSTVVLERGNFDSWLARALAQEVGLLNAGVTSTHLALWWCHPQVANCMAETLVPAEADQLRRPGLMRRLLATYLTRFSGQNLLGELVIRWAWPPLLKRDVYAADRWAAANDLHYELADFIHATRFPVDFASPWPWLSPTPGAEKRLSKLARHTSGSNHNV